jgi:hypothetical protein
LGEYMMELINDYKIWRYITTNNSMLPLRTMNAQMKKWHALYSAAEPFPHIVIDDFFNEGIINRVNDEFIPPNQQKDWMTFRHPLEWNKNATANELMIPFFTRHLIYELNSQLFINFLEDLTGFNCLVPDPYMEGGGLHAVLPGGRLEVHADFNSHPQTRFRRKVNLLLYLNDDWDSSYAGELELWDKNMKACVRSVEPIINRMVIFNSTSTSFHGHPEPLKCPENRIRKSIAVYYYSPDQADDYKTTDYKERPNA